MKICEHNVERIKEIVNEHKHKPTPLMMILEAIQNEFGYVPLEVQEIVAQELDIPVASVYGVVTFYSFFSMQPKGRCTIGVCLGTACYVKGSQKVIDKFCELLHIKPGQTTVDGDFTVDALRCIGACGVAPAVSINGKVYPKVSTSDVKRIINECRGAL